MILQKYQNRYNVEPDRELEAYCRMEGIDPLFIRRIGKMEKSQQKPKRVGRALRRLLGKWIERIKSHKLTNPQY